MTESKAHFIVIDDSRLDCFIAEKVIKNSGNYLSVVSYNDAREALEFIRNSSTEPEAKTVLIVDVQMPLMNGFEFIEAFEKLPSDLRRNYHVNVLTSSTNPNDISRIRGYKSVENLLNKPLSPQSFATILKNS